MNKIIFALFGAVAMTLIPTNVNAIAQETDPNGNCFIKIASGETATVNYDTMNCYIENNGTLTINGGANIVKLSRFDSYGAINNNGTLTINGGNIEARGGYAIKHNAGTLTINGGSVSAPLHQVIWGKPNTKIYINGGNFKSAIGGEQAIFTKGTLRICGGTFNATDKYNDAAIIEKCPTETEAKPAAATPTTTTPVATTTEPERPATSTRKKATTPAATSSAATETRTEEAPVTEAEPAKTEEKSEVAKTEDKNITPIVAKSTPSNDNLGTAKVNVPLAFIITLISLGTATAGSLFIFRH